MGSREEMTMDIRWILDCMDREIMKLGKLLPLGWEHWVVGWLNDLVADQYRDPNEPAAWKVTFIGNKLLPADVDADVIFGCFGDQCRLQLRLSKGKAPYRRRYRGDVIRLPAKYARIFLGIEPPDGLPDPAEVKRLWSKFLVAFRPLGLPETPPDPVLLCTADVEQYLGPIRRVLVDVPVCLTTREVASAAVIWPGPKRGNLWRWGDRIVLDSVQPGDLLEVAAYRQRSSGVYEAWYGLVLAITPVFLAAIPIGDRLPVEITQRYPGYAKRGIRLFKVLGTRPARVMVQALGGETELPLRELSLRSIATGLGLGGEEVLSKLLRIYKTNPDAARALIVL